MQETISQMIKLAEELDTLTDQLPEPMYCQSWQEAADKLTEDQEKSLTLQTASLAVIRGVLLRTASVLNALETQALGILSRKEKRDNVKTDNPSTAPLGAD